jgi:peptidoglycan/LPS O-acetylase OafA/YrhL
MDWLGVLTVFPMALSPMDWHSRPVPSMWSVGVELLNYAMLFIFVARSRWTALLTALVATGYHAWSIWHGDDLASRYFPFYAALLPFALGSLIYFDTRSRKQKSVRTAIMLCVPAASIIVVTTLLGGMRQTPLFELLFYCNLAAQCLAIWALFDLMLATLPASALVAYVACRCQDAIIEPIRNGIRAAAVFAGPHSSHQAVA